MIVRHAFMNTYFVDHENGISHIERYFDSLTRRVCELNGTAIHAT